MIYGDDGDVDGNIKDDDGIYGDDVLLEITFTRK